MKNNIPVYISIFLILTFIGCEDNDDDPLQQDQIHLIYDFTPLMGSVGSEVTIRGSHFSEIPSENLVKFNDKKAEVLHAETAELKTKVPAGATTGKISVTVRGITTVSTEDFIVD